MKDSTAILRGQPLTLALVGTTPKARLGAEVPWSMGWVVSPLCHWSFITRIYFQSYAAVVRELNSKAKTRAPAAKPTFTKKNGQSVNT